MRLSIRFYNDREVRAIWNEECGEWFFAIVDIVAAITLSEAPRKYWSVLKTRLKRQGNELATNCSQLKLLATDGKRYNTDCIAMSKVAELAKVIPSKASMSFLDWLMYADNTIDGQSKQKAYQLFMNRMTTYERRIKQRIINRCRKIEPIPSYLCNVKQEK